VSLSVIVLYRSFWRGAALSCDSNKSRNRSPFNKLLLISTFQEFPKRPPFSQFLAFKHFERSKAVERLERLELAAACVSDWNDRLPMEVICLMLFVNCCIRSPELLNYHPVRGKNGFRKCRRNDDLLVGRPRVPPLPSLFALNRRRAWELWVSSK
jgi:hypothetical protein